MKKEHRIVFLDLDQVLYDYQTRTGFVEPDKPIVEYRVETEAVGLLATTLAEMGAEIVFITSWSEDKIRHELYNDLRQDDWYPAVVREKVDWFVNGGHL